MISISDRFDVGPSTVRTLDDWNTGSNLYAYEGTLLFKTVFSLWRAMCVDCGRVWHAYGDWCRHSNFYLFYYFTYSFHYLFSALFFSDFHFMPHPFPSSHLSLVPFSPGVSVVQYRPIQILGFTSQSIVLFLRVHGADSTDTKVCA